MKSNTFYCLHAQNAPNPAIGIPKPLITDDFKDMEEFLRSCDCLEELEIIVARKVKLRNLPKYSVQELKDLGIESGPAKEMHDALAKYH